jgi:hypothetical protein
MLLAAAPLVAQPSSPPGPVNGVTFFYLDGVAQDFPWVLDHLQEPQVRTRVDAVLAGYRAAGINWIRLLIGDWFAAAPEYPEPSRSSIDKVNAFLAMTREGPNAGHFTVEVLFGTHQRDGIVLDPYPYDNDKHWLATWLNGLDSTNIGMVLLMGDGMPCAWGGSSVRCYGDSGADPIAESQGRWLATMWPWLIGNYPNISASYEVIAGQPRDGFALLRRSAQWAGEYTPSIPVLAASLYFALPPGSSADAYAIKTVEALDAYSSVSSRPLWIDEYGMQIGSGYSESDQTSYYSGFLDANACRRPNDYARFAWVAGNDYPYTGALWLGLISAFSADDQPVWRPAWSLISLFQSVGSCPPSLSLETSSVSVSEGAGSATGRVVLHTSGGSQISTTVSVRYATASATAVTPGDYGAVSGLIEFAVGARDGDFREISIPISDDTCWEGNEAFTFSLLDPVGARLVQPVETITIVDDDPPPAVSINDPVQVQEPDSGSTTLTFTVSLSRCHGVPTSVQYATRLGTAVAGTNYQAASGTLTFAPGEMSKPVTVTILSDPSCKSDLTFYLDLSSPSPSAVTLAKARGVGSIREAQTCVWLRGVAMNEGNTGTTPFEFSVMVSRPVTGPLSVDWGTWCMQLGGGAGNLCTATRDLDFTPSSGRVEFNLGDPTTKTVTVPVIGDAYYEPDEYFWVRLTNVVGGALAADATPVMGLIRNDDPQGQVVVSNPSIVEGNAGTSILQFTVTLPAPTGQELMFKCRTVDGTALAGEDYQAITAGPGPIVSPGCVRFPVGTMGPKTVSVTIKGDTQPETDETFELEILRHEDTGGPSGRDIVVAAGQATIRNDDGNAAPAHRGARREPSLQQNLRMGNR